MLRALVVGMSSAVVAGVLIGVVSRILMRAATGYRFRWVLGAGVLVLFVPATGVASEELGEIGDLSALRLCFVGIAGLSICASLVSLPFATILVLRRLERIAGALRRFPDSSPVEMQR